MGSCVLQSLQRSCSKRRRHRRESTARGVTRSFRVFIPSQYRRRWLGEPALPFALASAVRGFRSGRIRPCLSDQINPLFEFRSPSASCPASPEPVRPQPAGPSPGLCIPTAHAGIGDSDARNSESATVPPSGFGYPLDGFHPPTPGRPCFVPAALMGFSLRSVLPDRGCRRVSAPIAPTCRSSVRDLLPPKRKAGPNGRGSWASTPGRVPRHARGG